MAWALIGGWAAGLRAEPRFTRDVDLAIAVSDDAAAEAMTRRLLDSAQLTWRWGLSIDGRA